jgi:hypothetical protein
MIENKCRICKNEVQGNYKLCITCLRGVQISILEYFNLQESEPCDIFGELYSDFHDSFKRDLEEVYECIKNELWSACNLLIFRILDYNLNSFVKYDMDFNISYNMGLCIKKMEEMNFDQRITEFLDVLRKLRNKVMHTSIQIAPKETLNNIRKAYSIIVWIKNSY